MPIYEAFIVTNHVIPKYGGVRLSDQMLESIAADVRSGTFPMPLDHDSRQRLDPVILDVDVRPTADGSGRGVWVRYALSDHDAIRVGERRAFSVALQVPLWREDMSATSIPNAIAADATHFDPGDVVAAAREVNREVPTEARHILQFTDTAEVAKVVVIMLSDPFLQQIASGLLVNAITSLLSRKKTNISEVTHIELRSIRESEGEKITDEAIIVSRDPDVISEALRALPGRMGAGHTSARNLLFDSECGDWIAKE